MSWRHDPALGQLAPTRRVVELLPPLGPISIRDQAVRGSVVARRADRYWLSDEKPEHVIVAGAGVAGISTALVLAELGHRVLVVDPAPRPFHRQMSSTGRFIDPHFYDWPLSSFAERRFPATGDAPLAFEAGFADELAQAWYEDLALGGARFLASTEDVTFEDGRICIWQGVRCLGLRAPAHDDDESMVSVQFAAVGVDGSVGRTETLECALLVVATGFRENLSFPESAATERIGLESPAYWGDVEWMTNADVVGAGAGRVLVVGGGDGAIQDFLRLVSGHDDPRDLLGALAQSFGDANTDEVRRRLVVHDQAFWRSMPWCDARADVRRLHGALDAVCSELASELLADRKKRGAWIQQLTTWKRTQGWTQLDLCVRGENLDPMFAFNRFAVHLLLGLGADLKGIGLRVLLGHSVVTGEDAGGGSATVQLSGEGGSEGAEYDRVLLRFGLSRCGIGQGLPEVPRVRLLPPPYLG